MLNEDIRKDFDLRTESLPAAEGVVGVAFDQALIGQHGASVDIDADETTVACRAKGECSAGIVAEDIEADGQIYCGANGATRGGHGGHGLGSDVCFRERNVTEIFDEERVSTSAFVGVGVSNGSGDYSFQVALPARRAGEGMEVDDAD